MDQAKLFLVIGLIIFGFISILLGIALLCWVATQAYTRGGEQKVDPWADRIRAVGELVAQMAKYFPDSASRIGAFLILAGLLMLGAAYYIGFQ